MQYKATFIQNYSIYEQLDTLNDTKCNNLTTYHKNLLYYVSFGWKLAGSILESLKDTWLNTNIFGKPTGPSAADQKSKYLIDIYIRSSCAFKYIDMHWKFYREGRLVS